MSATTFRSDQFNANKKDSGATSGKKMLSAFFHKTVTSATSAIGDIFILGGPYTLDDKVQVLRGVIPSLTSANNCDFGFYKKNEDGTFTALGSGNEIVSGADLSGGNTAPNIIANLNTSFDTTKNIGGLLSLTSESQPPSGVFVGVLFKVANTAVSVIWNTELVVQEANTK